MFVRSWMTAPVVAIETSATVSDGLRVRGRATRRVPGLRTQGCR